MSKSFAFSANAEPFVPDPLCEEKMKMKLESRILTLEAQLEEERLSKMRLIKSYQSEKAQVNSFSEKNFKDLEKENERLNKHIRDGATKLLYERDKVRERDTLIIQQKEKNTSFGCRIAQLECDNSNWYRKYEELEMTYEKMKKEVQNHLEEKDEWTGRCLRLDFIFKKMKQIEALPEDHGAWVWDMVEDIEFPTDHQSIYLSLPRSVRNQYLPSESDAGIQFQQDENTIIEDLSLEAQAFNQNLSEHFRRNLDENPELIMNHIRTIQTRFREYIRPDIENQIKAAIKIQSVWRGFCGRGIISYKGTLEVNSSLTIYKLIPDKKIKSTHQIVPEHMRDRAFRMNFANTGKEIIHYQWLKIQPHTLEGKVGREYSIKPGEVLSIKVYFGHWFRFMSVSDEEEQFFRIMPEGFLGNLGRNIWGRPTSVFDLNTKITITKDHYDEWSKGVLGPHAGRVPNINNSIIRIEADRFNRIINTDHLNVPNVSDNVPDNVPENVPENDEDTDDEDTDDEDTDDEDTDDEATLQLAIQLSLETFTSLTSDMDDLNIADIFL